MINILIPIVENPDAFAEFVRSKNAKKYKIFVGITENLADKFKVKTKNVEIHKFKNKSNKEEIVNALHSCKLSEGKLMILRRVPTEEEFASLENSTKEIVVLKAKQNRFVSACKRLLQKVISKFFAFSYFEDISAICYTESMFRLLSVCPNLSMASRINKYIGITVQEVETSQKSVKKDYNRLKSSIIFVLATLFMLGSLAAAICLFVFVPPRALNIILTIFAFVVVLLVWFIMLVNFLRSVAVGDLRFGRAEEII